jgi:hypothetical protein
MLAAGKIHYEIADRTRAISAGGIGVIHMLSRVTGLIREIDERVKVLKIHKPYHESDHVLNVAYNALCGGQALEHIEVRRNDEAFLDALGAVCIPDPTTAGDFCRRFSESDLENLMTALNETRVRIWQEQSEDFFDKAIIEGDGTVVTTTGRCKEGMDIDRKGRWGYQPLVISLANTNEPLFLVNRGIARPSHEGAAARFDQAIRLVRKAGFRSVELRGDTDFSQTRHLDRWDGEGVRFIFGYDAYENLVQRAQSLPKKAWRRFRRPPKYEVKTKERSRPEDVRKRVVLEREFRNLVLEREDVAEFEYSPTACKRTYRMIALRKTISVKKGQTLLFPEVRYFFYITNDRDVSVREVVLWANDRCEQEKLIGHLKSEVYSLRAPVNDLLANWAYMIMTSLAWSLKAWLALLLPVSARWKERHSEERWKVLRMGFRTFVNGFMLMPAQILEKGRRLIYRLLSWNPWQHTLFRALDALHGKLQR